jgi:WS/DGAT/MGAT family acyltransferase
MQPFAERLSARDRLFLDLEGPNAPQHVAALCFLDAEPLQGANGGIDLARVRALVATRLHLVPRTRQRLAFVPIDQHPVWVDDAHFDLALHVLHDALPKPGGERALKKLVERLLAEPLDRERPLWELWVIEGLSPGRCALLAKVHHCMVDGVGGFEWFATLLSGAPGEELAETPRSGGVPNSGSERCSACRVGSIGANRLTSSQRASHSAPPRWARRSPQCSRPRRRLPSTRRSARPAASSGARSRWSA